MKPLLVKSIKDVCIERAKISANKKFDPIISELRDEYSKTRNGKIMQEIIKKSREKSAFQAKAFEYHMENYSHAEDLISDKVSESDKKKFNFKEFTDYLTEELMKI